MASRLAPLTADELTAATRATLRGRLASADRYLTGAPDAPALPTILGLLGHHPALGAQWLALSGVLMDDGVLAPRDRELIVLRVASRTGNRYEWSQHARIAERAGLRADEIAAAHGDPDTWPQDDGDLLRVVDQLIDAHTVDDETWARLTARFDERHLLEVLFVAGSYLCLALVLNSVGLAPDLPASEE